jgi:hypothetical protein
MIPYTLSILFFFPKTNSKEVIENCFDFLYLCTLGSIIGKILVIEIASNKLTKGPLRDYKSSLCSLQAFMVLEKIFKD